MTRWRLISKLNLTLSFPSSIDRPDESLHQSTSYQCQAMPTARRGEGTEDALSVEEYGTMHRQ